MKNMYVSFAQLNACEPKGAYRIELRRRASSVALIAPHAGRIEPGTSEICRSIAGKDLTYYLFEGCKPARNADLYIDSTRFDEPQCLTITQSSQIVATIYGQPSKAAFIYVGGSASQLVYTTVDLLRRAGYAASRPLKPALQGLEHNNLCNRGIAGQGIQLALSSGLRKSLLADTYEMDRFSVVVRAIFTSADWQRRALVESQAG